MQVENPIRASMNIKMLLFTFSLLLSSCVGTVKDKNPPLTKGITEQEPPIVFQGVDRVIPIAHDKIEVYFMPAEGRVDELTYLVSYDGADRPRTVEAIDLAIDYRGLLRFTLDRLSADTIYNIQVQVKNKDGNRSTTTQSESARTFSNLTANFYGIGDIKNLPGRDGIQGLRIEWPLAERTATNDANPADQDPVQYEIIMIDDEHGNPSDFDNEHLEFPYRRTLYVPGYQPYVIVNGLESGRLYHVLVRAIHSEYTAFGVDPEYKRESNNKYISAVTLEDEPPEFDANSLELSLPTGMAAAYSLNISWGSAVGIFDHYRVYFNDAEVSFSTYKNSIGFDPVCSGVESSNSSFSCKKVQSDLNSTSITGLNSFTEYEVNLIVCQTEECRFGEYVEFQPKTRLTSPEVAFFQGIETISFARNIYALDEVILNVSPPNLSLGFLDGIVVKVEGRERGGPFTDTYLNHPLENNNTDISIDAFDFLNVDSIVVRGIDINSSDPYCFSAKPYLIDDVGNVNIDPSNEVIRCFTPSQILEVPNQESFAGVTNVNNTTNNVQIFWDRPTNGLFDSYKVYLKVRNTQNFDYNEAHAGDQDYIIYSLPAEVTDDLEGGAPFSINLPGPSCLGGDFLNQEDCEANDLVWNNGVYRVGVLTYYSATGQYSQFTPPFEEFSVGDL